MRRDVLVDRDDLVAVDEPRSEAGHARAAVLQAQEHRALEVAERHPVLLLGDAVGDEAVDHRVDDLEQLAQPVRGGAAVDHEGADVAVGRRRREHRVGEAALLADLLEQPTRHAAAEHVVGHPQGVAVVVARGQAPPADGHVRLLGGTVDDDQRHDRRPAERCGPGARPARRRRRCRRPRPARGRGRGRRRRPPPGWPAGTTAGGTPATSSRVMASTESRVPRVSRPSG